MRGRGLLLLLVRVRGVLARMHLRLRGLAGCARGTSRRIILIGLVIRARVRALARGLRPVDVLVAWRRVGIGLGGVVVVGL